MKLSPLFLLIALITSCTFSGGTSKNNNKMIPSFISGAAVIDTVKDFHIINMIRAIGAPSNSIVIGKYKYYQWQHSRTIGISTLFGGGSTGLYCNLTAETQEDKIKMINWYGNQCGIFLGPIEDYFKDKLNIVTISSEDDKKQTVVVIKTVKKEESPKSKTDEVNSLVNDTKQKTSEQKIQETKPLEQTGVEQKVPEQKSPEQKPAEVKDAVKKEVAQEVVKEEKTTNLSEPNPVAKATTNAPEKAL